MVERTVRLDFEDRDLVILEDGDWRGFRSTPCSKEPETVAWIRSFDDADVLWDVGASVGGYTLIAGALGHSVVAFEPFAPSFGHLQQNTWLNRLPAQVQCAPLALGDAPGIRQLHVSGIWPGIASHGATNSGPVQTVVQTTVDEAARLFPDPDHVKIDVDGAELGVIEGGRETWKDVKSMMIESQPGVIEDIAVILASAGLQRASSHRRLGDTKQHNYMFSRA